MADATGTASEHGGAAAQIKKMGDNKTRVDQEAPSSLLRHESSEVLPPPTNFFGTFPTPVGKAPQAGAATIPEETRQEEARRAEQAEQAARHAQMARTKAAWQQPDVRTSEQRPLREPQISSTYKWTRCKEPGQIAGIATDEQAKQLQSDGQAKQLQSDEQAKQLQSTPPATAASQISAARHARPTPPTPTHTLSPPSGVREPAMAAASQSPPALRLDSPLPAPVRNFGTPPSSPPGPALVSRSASAGVSRSPRAHDKDVTLTRMPRAGMKHGDSSAVGIGILYERKGGQVVVSGVLGTAARDQISVGDVILRVDGVDVSRLRIQDVAPLIMGTQGTRVTLSIRPSRAPGGDPGTGSGRDSSAKKKVLSDSFRQRLAVFDDKHANARTDVSTNGSEVVQGQSQAQWAREQLARRLEFSETALF